MPLCPQITNTPITVVLNADFTVTNVVPVLPANTEQLAEVEILIDGKAEIYYQTTAPVGAGINENDLWYDTDDGNKPYVFRSGVWVSVQDGSIATAQSAANTALANAATANAVGVAAQGTANTALANAAIADAKGVAAQNTANTALANAATAFTAATGSLQPSANTIVNASNQMTAINGTGITVFSGASATSGARVVLNSVGLAGFNSGGSATFSVSASTGAAVFAGSVTGATITGGTLNIAGNAIIDASGFLTATGATITGTITTSNITVTGGTLTIGSTFAVTAGGVLSATGATITGTLTSNNITVTGGTLTIGSKFSVTSLGVLTAVDGIFTGTITSTNATITGGSLTVGSTFSVTSAGVLTATSGTVGGWTLSSTSFTNTGADTFLFANPGSDGLAYSTIGRGIMRRLQLNGASGTTLGTNVLAVGGNVAIDGATVSVGNVTAQSSLINSGIAIQNGTAVHILTGGRLVQSTSSERFKKNIVTIPQGGWLDKVTQIRPVNFQYDEAYSEAPDEIISGLIAEDIAEIPGFEHLIYNDPLGDPFSISYERLTVFLTLAIKELKAEIDQLKGA